MHIQNRPGVRLRAVLTSIVLLLSATIMHAQELDAAAKAQVDDVIARVMKQTGVPSVQFGIVRDGKIVYVGARGDARIGMNGKAAVAATPQMQYPIGSISKQFTVACLLLLQEQGKLHLDDPVAKWFPELTRANDITIRMLLTHTSGYRDFAPQDYTIPGQLKPARPIDTVHKWAELPLDFEPMTKSEYSNTNYTIAGLIVEKVSGEPIAKFVQENILLPLQMKNVLDIDTERARLVPMGYQRNALGPLRPAVSEAPGWYTGAGTLAMSAGTLLQWDLSLMNRTLLKPESYDVMEKEQRLKDGGPTNGGLGLQVGRMRGHLLLLHNGEIAGFYAMNLIMPEDHVAIAVFVNQDANQAAMTIAQQLMSVLVPSLNAKPPAPAVSATTQEAREILLGLQAGKIDRSQFTTDANFYFSAQALADYQQSLSPLGAVTAFAEVHTGMRGGMQEREYHAAFGERQVTVSTYWTTDGKLEQFLVEPE